MEIYVQWSTRLARAKLHWKSFKLKNIWCRNERSREKRQIRNEFMFSMWLRRASWNLCTSQKRDVRRRERERERWKDEDAAHKDTKIKWNKKQISNSNWCSDGGVGFVWIASWIFQFLTFNWIKLSYDRTENFSTPALRHPWHLRLGKHFSVPFFLHKKKQQNQKTRRREEKKVKEFQKMWFCYSTAASCSSFAFIYSRIF